MIISFSISHPFGEHKKALFEVMGKTGQYNVNILVECGVPKYVAENCDCKWGSWHGQRKEHKSVNKVCRHIEECLSFLEREGWIDPDWRTKKE